MNTAILDSITHSTDLSQQEILEANARLLAKREGRKRFYPSAGSIPIRTAGELVEELKPLIPIVFVNMRKSWVPIVDAVEQGYITEQRGKGKRKRKGRRQ